jgi:cell wall-associated NlpC family hydrolase
MTVGRAAVVECARRYLGTRWHHQGRSSAGLDCAGLVVRVAHDLGLSSADVGGYGRTPDGFRLYDVLRAHLVVTHEAQPGDVLLFRFVKNPMHLAILTEPGRMIHAYANARRVVEHRIDETWRRRIVDAFRLPGVED